MTLPVGWKLTTIGEVADINRRNPYLRELPDNLNVTFVPMAAVDAFSGMIAAPRIRSLGEVRKGFTPFSDGDVIFAKITPSMENGKAAVAKDLKNGLGFGSTEFHVISAKEGLLSTYIYYFIRQESFRRDAKANFAGTAGQLRVPSSFIGNYPFPLPPLTEQERIVARIEELFTQLEAGVAGLKRIQAALKRYKASVLKAAVSGKLLNGELVIGDGELPKGWRWVTVGDVATKVTDGTHKTPRYVDNGVPFISVNNISSDGIIDFSDCKFITSEEHEYLYKRCNPEIGDVLLTKVGTIGLTAVIKTNTIFSLFVNTALIKPAHEKILPNYLAYVLRYGFISESYEEYISGSTQKFIGNKKITQLPIPLPTLKEQQRINVEVDQRLSVATQVEATVQVGLKRAGRLRQAVLKSAFEGKLTA
ncbi:MAG: hypothetical protein A2Z49_12920 [Chloroflexi bacterium RBG_19FT_COMBO_56_12]|nr:MAG: hypothetical protein A2Z49_12920 [Chloroflexi bacterium RBG_19FT_COMBO_56_12]